MISNESRTLSRLTCISRLLNVASAGSSASRLNEETDMRLFDLLMTCEDPCGINELQMSHMIGDVSYASMSYL